MFDPEKMPSSAGGFPWKADGDLRTVVYIKNETEVERSYSVHLLFDGGQYSLGVNDIKPHQTVAVDFSTIRDEQIPDSMGRVIPSNAVTGQIAWSVKGGENHVLSGRSEQISLSGAVASTYSCYNCCPDSVYQTGILPSWIQMAFGTTSFMAGQQTDISCNGTLFGPYVVGSGIFWNSDNVNVVTADGGYLVATGTGTATISATWETCLVWFEEGHCSLVCDQITENASVEVAPPSVVIQEVGFTGDHLIHRWPPPGTAIDSPDGSSPTWKSTSNPDHPVAYTKEANITMFGKLSINPSIPTTNAKIRVKNGSTVIANKNVSISGTTANITGISTTAALENTVKKTTPTFTWEISYNDGTSWSSIGNSGPHTIYWTYATPLSPPFTNEAGSPDPALYDEALKKSTCYSNGASVQAEIVSKINGLQTDVPPQQGQCGTSIQGDIYYNPIGGIASQHPLVAYTTPVGIPCGDGSNLLLGLLRSIGINGTKLYLWAGPNSTTLFYYGRNSGLNTPSFQMKQSVHEGSTETNPHFFFHAVVSVNGVLYDPSFGGSYSSLSFIETANNNTPQQMASVFPATQTTTNPVFYCPH